MYPRAGGKGECGKTWPLFAPQEANVGDKNNMNTRANIMYFIEHFLDVAHKDGHSDYIRMMQRDIIRVVDAVAPDDGSGAANVKVVRKVMPLVQTGSYGLRGADSLKRFSKASKARAIWIHRQ